jgi:DNA-directed RNA polymerase specialized sigma24 family protein
MREATDEHFLRAWAEKADESAFRSLVGRYAGFVHGAALRRTRDAGLAEEITQDVFARLAQNAARLAGHPALSGWLHRAAMLFALERLRSRARHEKRLEEFAAMNAPMSLSPPLLSLCF